MSVWCVVKGKADKPMNGVSIRKLIKEVFDEYCGVVIIDVPGDYSFEFSFCNDGVGAAQDVDAFCQKLREARVRSDINAEIRFLT